MGDGMGCLVGVGMRFGWDLSGRAGHKEEGRRSGVAPALCNCAL